MRDKYNNIFKNKIFIPKIISGLVHSFVPVIIKFIISLNGNIFIIDLKSVMQDSISKLLLYCSISCFKDKYMPSNDITMINDVKNSLIIDCFVLALNKNKNKNIISIIL